MFLGQYSHSLDAKGRIAIPAKYRGELGNTVIVSSYLDGCIAIYSQTGWQEELRQLSQLDTKKSKARMYYDYRLANSFAVELDGQGRIIVPPQFRKDFGFVKDCVFTGAGYMIKLWPAEVWEAYSHNMNPLNMSNLADELD